MVEVALHHLQSHTRHSADKSHEAYAATRARFGAFGSGRGGVGQIVPQDVGHRTHTDRHGAVVGAKGG